MENIAIGIKIDYFRRVSHFTQRDFFFRGSKDYEVRTRDPGGWQRIAYGTFPDPRACVPLDMKVIKLAEAITGKYVQYWCRSYYGDGCSLQYIAVFQGNDV